MTPFDLIGKNILISGASSGLGRQCAISCSKMGATVILMGRDIARLEETLSQMEEPQRHLVCSGNLTDFDWVTQSVEDIVKEKGRLHGLLNCAGISATLPMKSVSREKLEEYFTPSDYPELTLTIKEGKQDIPFDAYYNAYSTRSLPLKEYKAHNEYFLFRDGMRRRGGKIIVRDDQRSSCCWNAFFSL